MLRVAISSIKAAPIPPSPSETLRNPMPCTGTQKPPTGPGLPSFVAAGADMSQDAGTTAWDVPLGGEPAGITVPRMFVAGELISNSFVRLGTVSGPYLWSPAVYGHPCGQTRQLRTTNKRLCTKNYGDQAPKTTAIHSRPRNQKNRAN